MPEQGSERRVEYIRADSVPALAREVTNRLWDDEGEAIMAPVYGDKNPEVRRISKQVKDDFVYHGMLAGVILMLEGINNGTLCIVTRHRKGAQSNG